MPIEVSRMTEADVDSAINTVQQAFADDPYNKWIYDDRSKFSPARNRVSLGLRCRWGIQHGLFYVAKDPASATPDKVLGTAMWLAPRPAAEPESWSLYLSYWRLWLSQVYMNAVYGRGGLNVKRYWIWKARQKEAQEALWTDPRGYYFCNIVTVLPEAQRRGVGRKLMEVVLEKADEEGMPAYLESSRNEPNVPIYEKFGFKLVREMECDDDGTGIQLYCMMRDPKGVKSSDDEEPVPVYLTIGKRIRIRPS
ncbi:acetyltransferase [Lineolata rhizophorae]|uniref:Acetyltransferase n=1 Tax=Lineolata rhizophorae TaxID=578093 RepID=A0A6A6NQJ0_9PEZI|nr:acetyltransferase [Lineolata rhizophorae]